MLAEQMVGHVYEFSLQMYGCRVIQKALEKVEYDQKLLLSQELRGSVIRCVEDQNGNHVVQKIIEYLGFNDEHINFLISEFKEITYKMSIHPYGCRVMQRMLEHCSQEIMEPIIEEIVQYTLNLGEDQYGNYAIQHILQFGSE